ncbi:hypothetical protein ACRS8P_32645 [Burkholderia cenocepacia]|uniref:hypothetical protein n=1 Tax=Burkholderia pseudomultivorans TaxID=1207504 RepID=UPI0007551D1A|nr:hypothetical protein [Burkholderia pseudomultivorans]KWF06918.1 hypothetical protein WT55_19560 [Burkholderia pseudomultivorans]
MNSYPTDRLISGAIVGTVVTAVIILIMAYINIAPEQLSGAVSRVAISMLIASCALLPRPLLLRTVLRERRDPLLLDEDMNMLLLGRVVGMIGGLLFGITLAAELL